MRYRTSAAGALLALSLIAGSPMPAAYASGFDVLYDCMDDEMLSRPYSQKEYADALAAIPADSDEYADCRRVIERARLAAAAGNGDGAREAQGGDSALAPSLDAMAPGDRADAQRLSRSGAALLRQAAAGNGTGPAWLPRSATALAVGQHALPPALLALELVLGGLVAAAGGVGAARSLGRRRRARSR
jgi:hypothetical protein